MTSPARFSQRTLGLVRDILIEMGPQDARSSTAINAFWKSKLFDFGIDVDVIDVMVSHRFRWVNIIPDLYQRRLGNNDSYSAKNLYGPDQANALAALVAFAMAESRSDLIPALQDSLISDGFEVRTKSEADTEVPKELKPLPDRDTMRAELEEMSKSGLVALLYIDLDNFKSVNDKLSHEDGNQCLIRTVGVISAAILYKGKLYRWGGDEFTVVLRNFTFQEAEVVAERIRTSIDEANPGGAVK